MDTNFHLVASTLKQLIANGKYERACAEGRSAMNYDEVRQLAREHPDRFNLPKERGVFSTGPVSGGPALVAEDYLAAAEILAADSIYDTHPVLHEDTMELFRVMLEKPTGTVFHLTDIAEKVRRDRGTISDAILPPLESRDFVRRRPKGRGLFLTPAGAKFARDNSPQITR